MRFGLSVRKIIAKSDEWFRSYDHKSAKKSCFLKFLSFFGKYLDKYDRTCDVTGL